MAHLHSWKLVGFGTVALVAGFAATGGCSSSTDNSARNGTGGTGATSGTTATGATAGTLSAAGTNSAAGTIGIAGSTAGGSTGAAGSAAAGSSSGGASGGAVAAGGSGGSGGATCTPPVASATSAVACALPTTTAANPLIYDGATSAPNCGTAIGAAPRAGYWFNYGDATSGAQETGAGKFGGCGGMTDCAYHASGCGYGDYGAGMGFDLMDNASQAAQPYDATAYMGLQFYARGTITGTRGPKYAQADQSLHIKFVTMTNRSGDDYGGYCMISMDWTKCSLAFAMATRDGFSTTPPVATDMLDVNQMLKIQLEFSKSSPAADAGVSAPVAFDVLVDDVSFF